MGGCEQDGYCRVKGAVGLGTASAILDHARGCLKDVLLFNNVNM